MQLDQLLDWLQKVGPGGIMAIMWWFAREDAKRERAERIRMQMVIESFLPVVEANARVTRALRRVVVGNENADDAGDRG